MNRPRTVHRARRGVEATKLLVLGIVFGVIFGACTTSNSLETGSPDLSDGDTSESATTESSVVATSTTDPPQVDDDLPFGLVRCQYDAARISADPSWYRDEPIYIGNEQPTEQVRDFAQDLPGFTEIWIDRDHNGWITVGVVGDAELITNHQAELEAQFPAVGVVAVAVPYSNAELEALRAEIEPAMAELNNWSMGHSASRGLVEVGVPVLDAANLERLAPFADRPLCVDGADPTEAIPAGPQPTEGDGWRLLAEATTGQVYRTGVATTDQQLNDLWSEAGVSGSPSSVDFESEIAIWFGAVYGSSCPIRMDDVVVDTEAGLIHGLFVTPGNPVVCTSDANAHAFVVALERTRLPVGPFAVQLDADDPPGGAPEERTKVMVDLSTPGSVATADQLVVTTLDQMPDSGPDLFTPGEVIEDGYPAIFRLDLACGVKRIGPLNDVVWQAVDGPNPNPPTEWQQAADDGDVWPEAEFVLETDPAQLTITIAGHSEIYQPIPASGNAEPAPSC